MSYELIKTAISKGASVYSSVSGGKDGQAATRTMIQNGIPLAGLIHMDLGRSEWPQSLPQCQKQANEYALPLHILTRTDGRDLVAHMEHRMRQLKDTGKPFWPSKSNRYCTSDLKRDVANKFLTAASKDIVICAEGIRAEESTDRAKLTPLSIRQRITSTYYDGMSVEEAVAAFQPGKRLALTWYPMFNMTLDEVWATYDMDMQDLHTFRWQYNEHGTINPAWPFHPAYAMGNDRVSCMFCILGSPNDLRNGAKQNPELLREMIAMEDEGDATFKQNFSLKQLL